LNKLYRKSYRNISQKDNQTLFRKKYGIKNPKIRFNVKKVVLATKNMKPDLFFK
jgi:hypothetical protein